MYENIRKFIPEHVFTLINNGSISSYTTTSVLGEQSDINIRVTFDFLTAVPFKKTHMFQYNMNVFVDKPENTNHGNLILCEMVEILISFLRQYQPAGNILITGTYNNDNTYEKRLQLHQLYIESLNLYKTELDLLNYTYSLHTPDIDQLDHNLYRPAIIIKNNNL